MKVVATLAVRFVRACVLSLELSSCVVDLGYSSSIYESKEETKSITVKTGVGAGRFEFEMEDGRARQSDADECDVPSAT